MWLKTVALQGSNLRIGITKQEDVTTQGITMEQFKKLVLRKTGALSLIVSKPEMDPNGEIGR